MNNGDVQWGIWKCTKCHTQNSGKDRACNSCGDERDYEELRDIKWDDSAPVVTDENELKQARLGPDWFCKACNVTVQNTNEKCSTCGAKKNATVEDLMWRAKTRAGDPLERALLIDEAGDEQGRQNIKTGGTEPWWSNVLSSSKSRFKAVDPRTKKASILILSVVVISLFIYFIWWGMQTHQVIGTVAGVNWQHDTIRQTWRPVLLDDWCSDLSSRAERPPVNGKGEVPGVAIKSTSRRVHHYNRIACGTETYLDTERYSCGSHQSCSWSSNGNGSRSRSCSTTTDYCSRSVTKTRTKYCQDPVYRDYCSYETQQWFQSEVKVAKGTGYDTTWREIVPGTLDRIVHREDYAVRITYDSDKETIARPSNEPDFKAFQIGKVLLDVRNFGSVSQARPYTEIVQ